jgi:hypothetical protein
MAYTLIRQDNLHKPDSFDDTLNAAAIAGIESSAVTHADFWTGVLSQVKRILWGSNTGNWHDDPTDFTGIDGTLTALANRATLEGKQALVYRMNINDVTVAHGANFQALTGSTKPDKNIAISVSNQGGVTAQLAGSIGSHSLDEIAGSNPLRPKSIVAVFEADSGDPILSSGRRVWGLLQVGSAATDGNPFGDSGNDQGQISFVRANATYDDLEACPVADIEDQDIIYAFTWREDLDDLPEEFFRGELESADPQPGVTVSLDSAYDGGYYMTVDGSDVDIRLDDTKSWVFRAGSGGAVLWQILRNDSTGDKLTVTTDDMDFNNVNSADFNQGVKVDTGDQTVNLGVTTGQIDSTTLTVAASTGDLTLSGADDVSFITVRETSALPLDDGTAGKISTLFGQTFASISAAIKYAGEQGGVDMTLKTFTAGSSYAQDANIPAAVQDITSYPIDMNTVGTVKQFVWLNGRLLFGGNGTTQNDCYAGDTPASGDLKVDLPGGIHIGDVIISIVLAQ